MERQKAGMKSNTIYHLMMIGAVINLFGGFLMFFSQDIGRIVLAFGISFLTILAMILSTEV